MKPILKYAGIAIAVILLLLISLLAYVKFAFDPNDFKTDIVQYVKEKKQRTLAIEGDIKLTIFPQLGVQLEKASLSAYKSNAAFASFKEAHISLALMPLLKKKLLVDKISLDGLQLHYSRDMHGVSNIDDLLKPTPEEQSSEKMQFDVEGIHVTNANILIDDAQNKMNAQIKDVQFTSGRLADKTLTSIQLSAHVLSQNPQADSVLKLASKLYFDLEKQVVKLDQVDFSIKGLLEKQKLEASINAQQLHSQLKENTFSVENFDAKVKSTLVDDTVQLHIKVPQLDVNQASAKGKAITGEFTMIGKSILKSQFTLSNVSGNSQEIKLEQAKFDVSTKQDGRDIKAQFQSAMEVHLLEQRFFMPRFTLNIQVNDPSLAQPEIKIPFSGELHANLKDKTIRADMKSQFDESKLASQITVLGFEQPAFAFTTEIDQINLDRYLGKSKPTASTTPTTPTSSETNIDLSALKGLNINGKISIGKFQVSDMKLNALHIPLRIAQGKLVLKDYSAQLYQGSLIGNATIDASTHLFQVQQKFSNVSIHPLLVDAISKDMLEGRGDVALQLQSQGKTISELKRGLDGKISASLTDGAVKGMNVAKTLRDFKSKILGKADQNQQANTAEKTDFSALQASILFNKGIGHSNDLQLQSPFLRVGGEGKVNLHNDSLDYVANVTVVNTSTGQDGKDLSQLKDLTIPVRIFGPFHQIDYQLQFSKITSEAIKSALKEKAAPIIDEKKKEIEEKLKNSLKDKLKGIF